MMKGLINKIIRIIKMKIKIKKLFEVITKRVDFVNLDVKINIFKGFEIYNNSDKIACFEFDEMWAVLMLGTQFFCALVYSLCIKYSIEKYWVWCYNAVRIIYILLGDKNEH